MTEAPDDLLDDDAAARVAGVAPEGLDALVAQGALTPVEGEGARRFRRAEAEAIRHLGA
ncbi:MAG: hypothetical protein KDB04_04110 [Acidimicrobiales bacterium]|nr:hypothetical protein [Acidimicrobiales bacterium]HRW38343.1 hypothetical protein [Aquihabitans sp.]